jgi:anti-sigma B factor antagonist
MELKARIFESIYILDVAGEIDCYNSGKFKDLIQRIIVKHSANIIINFESVNYIDSSGIGALIYINSFIKNKQLNVRLANIHGSVKKVIELTKLTGYLPISDTIQNAIANIKRTINVKG